MLWKIFLGLQLSNISTGLPEQVQGESLLLLWRQVMLFPSKWESRFYLSILFAGKSVKECKSLYFRFKDKVFVGKRPYDEVALERFLRSEFGEKTMADLTGPKYVIPLHLFELLFLYFWIIIGWHRVLVTAVIADTIPSDLHIFRNYPSPQDLLSLPEASKQEKPEQQLMWQAARASGAAPTYFR